MLAIVMLLPGFVEAIPTTTESNNKINVERIAGKTRVQTSIEASRVAYKDGADTILLAGYSGEVDALTGTLLANNKEGPLLLTSKNKVSEGIEDELLRLKAENIIILGGENVVSENVKVKLDQNYNVRRVAGKNRAETAVKIAKEVVGERTNHIFLALGYNELADALAIGPASAMNNLPVLLTQTNRLPSETKKAIKDLNVKEVTIIGGKAAISERVEKELGNLKINRIAGSRREETAVKIAEKYFKNSTTTIVAYGWNYADALVGGYLGALIVSPILLTRTDSLPPATKMYIRDHAEKSYVLGGESVVNNSVFKKIQFAREVNIEDAKYIGNRNTKVFHRLKCRALPDKENRAYFEFREDAVKEGLVACKICKP